MPGPRQGARPPGGRLDRRELLIGAGGALAALAMPGGRGGEEASAVTTVKLFLCGDVMTGRGIDQVLPHPGDPRLHEPWVRSARRYVDLAEAANGPIPRPVGFPYVWGDALEAWRRASPDLRLANLETAVTARDEAWPDKGIHYRMHPANVPCLAAAGLDACALANNHVLDWGRAGLADTLEALARAGIATAGAGRDREQAEAPAILPVPGKGRVVVFACGSATAGIPAAWAAGDDRPGIDLLPDLGEATVERLAARVARSRRAGDLVVASIHWGANWGYAIPGERRRFAQRLVDVAGVDVVHGHSAHHPQAIELHRGKPILYGCGDFLTDYEGIEGHERFRGDLALGYFLDLERARGTLVGLTMVPFQLRRFRLVRASDEDTRWLAATLDRESRPLGARITTAADGTLRLEAT